MKFLALEPSPISIYSESMKTISFSILGFFRLGIKLGFDFPGVSPNQKYWTRSLKLYFDEERNPIPSSLKNSSSVKSPNFPQQKLKIPRIKFCFNRKMCPSMESYPSLLLLVDCGKRRKKKVIIPRFHRFTVSSSHISFDTMLDFYHLSNMILGSYLRE